MGDIEKYSSSLTPPQNFSPNIEVSGCFCLYRGTILLLKRNPNRPQGGKWGLPGGKFERGEDALAAIVRELYEEIAIKLGSDQFEKIGVLYNCMPDVQYTFHMFYTHFATKPMIALCEEHTEARWLTTIEARKLPLMFGGENCLEYFEKTILKKS